MASYLMEHPESASTGDKASLDRGGHNKNTSRSLNIFVKIRIGDGSTTSHTLTLTLTLTLNLTPTPNPNPNILPHTASPSSQSPLTMTSRHPIGVRVRVRVRARPPLREHFQVRSEASMTLRSHFGLNTAPVLPPVQTFSPTNAGMYSMGYKFISDRRLEAHDHEREADYQCLCRLWREQNVGCAVAQADHCRKIFQGMSSTNA